MAEGVAVRTVSEVMSTSPRCSEGHYHFFPQVLPVLLDRDANELPREGVQTGRLALFDLPVETREVQRAFFDQDRQPDPYQQRVRVRGNEVETMPLHRRQPEKAMGPCAIPAWLGTLQQPAEHCRVLRLLAHEMPQRFAKGRRQGCSVEYLADRPDQEFLEPDRLFSERERV